MNRMFEKKYSHYYDLFNSDKPYKDEIKFVYEWAEKPKSIFDIGAGTASYWKHYPQSVKLSGIERSAEMIQQKVGRGVLNQGDVMTLGRPKKKYDCATALFDVLNYMPNLDWIDRIPVKRHGFFIFDVWDTDKIRREGFSVRTKKVGDFVRRITPLDDSGKPITGSRFVPTDHVNLLIEVCAGRISFKEKHTMYLHTMGDIERACGDDYIVMDTRATDTWQRWYKLARI